MSSACRQDTFKQLLRSDIYDEYYISNWSDNYSLISEYFMITEAILNFFTGLGVGFIDLFPTISLSESPPMPTSLIGVINGVSCIMPVGTLGIAIGVYFVLLTSDLIMSIVHWIIRKIPTIN